jgi:hypothetical protein
MVGRFSSADSCVTVRRVCLAVGAGLCQGPSRVAAIADDGVVLTGLLDHEVVSHGAAAMGSPYASRRDYVRLATGVSFVDVDMVVL